MTNEHDPVALADKIAERLRGTCGTLSAVLDSEDAEYMEDNAIFCARLDSLVFCCTACDWWHEQSEMADRQDEEWICVQCTDDDDLRID